MRPDPNPPRFFGKYRGKVEDNVDPLLLARLQVAVPRLQGVHLNWAMPCVPYAGPMVGFFALPPIGASVWVEFEGGDPNYPIWTGCFWEEGEVPAEPAVPEIKVFKTEYMSLILNNLPGETGLTIEVLPPAVEVPMSLTFTEQAVTLTCAESTITVTPELINLNVAPSSINVTAEEIGLEIPPSTITMTEEGIAVETEIVTVTADVSVEGAIEVTGDVEILGGVEIQGNVDVTGAVEIEGDVVIAAINVEVASATAVEVETPALAIVAAAMALTGIVAVEGDLLIDGQQPLVI